MKDIKLFLNDPTEDGIAPRIENGDFVADEGLETAVILSLFSDARVTAEQLPQGQTYRRGYWGDKFSTVDQDVSGSRLWTLRREKRTTEVLRKFEDLAVESLNWMIEDGVAKTVIASASFDPVSKFLVMNLVITQPTGITRFKVNWDKQLVSRS